LSTENRKLSPAFVGELPLAADGSLGLLDAFEHAALMAPVPGLGQHSTKLARSLHSGRIAVALREAIISGSLRPGTPLVEMRLAEQLAVSRGPVRSALHVLEGEGLVETKPNGRMVVVGFDQDDLRDLFAVRYSLEAEAIEWGVARGRDTRPVENAFAAIEAEGNSTPRLVSLDIDFHRRLVEFSGSRFLTRSWLALAPVIQAVITIGNRHLVEADPGSNFGRIVDSHRLLMDALVSREAEAAARMLAEQFDFSKSMFLFGEDSRATGG